MADIAEAMAKRGFSPLTDEDLCGHSIDDVKCRACSGYGNCGYKTFRLYDGKPYSVCNLRLGKAQFPYVIKPMESVEDAREIGRIRSESWHEAYAGLIEQSALDKRSPEYCMKRAIVMFEEGGTAALAFDEEGEAVGFVIYGICRDKDATEHTGEVYALYTLKRTYGSGLGRELLEFAEDELAKADLDQPIVLWALATNGRGRAFYEKNGYVPDGKIKALPELGEGVLEVRLAKDEKFERM